MNATQCRMGRAGLGWTLEDLAKESGTNRRSIYRFENGRPVLRTTVAKLRRALENAGVVFIKRGAYRGGVVPPVEGAD